MNSKEIIMKDIIKVTLFAITLISYISAFVLFMQSTRMPVSDNEAGIVTGKQIGRAHV